MMSKRSIKMLPASTIWAVVIVLIADRISKIWVVNNLPFEEPVVIIPALKNIFTLTYIRNSGAAFGMLPNMNWFFAIIAILVVAAVVIWYDTLPVQHLPGRIAVGMVLGGAIGNLVDRARTGNVVDFLHLHFWPIFNVADCSLVVGVIIIGLYLILEEKAAEKADSQEKAIGQ